MYLFRLDTAWQGSIAESKMQDVGEDKWSVSMLRWMLRVGESSAWPVSPVSPTYKPSHYVTEITEGGDRSFFAFQRVVMYSFIAEYTV